MTQKRVIPKEKLNKLYNKQGLTIQEVARELNTSEHTVRRNMEEQGIHIETNSEIHTKHGMAGTRPYRIWATMRNRCSNPNHPNYEEYGNQGISYPEKWDDFEVFWEEMKGGYSDDKTIDRIDGTKSYSKGNCRWVDYNGQNRNKQTNKRVTYNGKTQIIMDWARELNIPFSTLYRRKSDGWNDKEIIEGR